MDKWLEKAMERLKKEEKEAKKANQYADVMTEEVKRQLEEFCRQDEEFAQAVVQGGSFTECMKTVSKNCGRCLSDVEAYKRAVQFYFPGAEVRVKMWVDLAGKAGEGMDEAKEKKTSAKLYDLADFL